MTNIRSCRGQRDGSYERCTTVPQLTTARHGGPTGSGHWLHREAVLRVSQRGGHPARLYVQDAVAALHTDEAPACGAWHLWVAVVNPPGHPHDGQFHRHATL